MVASLVSATDGPAVPAWVPVAREDAAVSGGPTIAPDLLGLEGLLESLSTSATSGLQAVRLRTRVSCDGQRGFNALRCQYQVVPLVS